MTQSLTLLATTLACSLTLSFVSCEKNKTSGGDHHDATGHVHGPDCNHGSDHEEHVHGPDCNHAKRVAGPNGGLVLTAPDFIAEFFVTKDNKIRFTFLDQSNKPIAVAQQHVSMVCGDTNPTTLAFSKDSDGMSLISDKTLPAGNLYGVAMTVKTTPDGDELQAKIKLNLSHCSDCNLQEYACTCDHGDHH